MAIIPLLLIRGNTLIVVWGFVLKVQLKPRQAVRRQSVSVHDEDQ
jgi:hypothetical protein